MSDPAVLLAVRKKLRDMPGLPDIIWPNTARKLNPPFLTFDNGVVLGTPITLDGEEAWDIRPQVSLHVKQNSGTIETDTILRSIALEFRFDAEITDVGGARLGKCYQTPSPDNGETFGGLFRRNMILRIASYQQV